MKNEIDPRLFSAMHKLSLFVGGIPNTWGDFNSETANGYVFTFVGKLVDLLEKGAKTGYEIFPIPILNSPEVESGFFVIGLLMQERNIDVYYGADPYTGMWLTGVEFLDDTEIVYIAVEINPTLSYVISARNDSDYELINIFVSSKEEHDSIQN